MYTFYQQKYMVFANGVKIEKNKAELINKFSGEQSQDRAYINKFFTLLHSDRHLMKLATKHRTREIFLEDLRKSKRCATIKGRLTRFFDSTIYIT